MNTLEALVPIIDAIQPFERPWLDAWARFGNGEAEADVNRLKAATAALNAEIEKHIESIANLTNNSTTTLQSVFAPRTMGSAWFSGVGSPVEFLRQVAKHGSFNPEFWTSQERKADREQWLERACSASPELRSPQDAAADLARGVVPRLKAADAGHGHWLSAFDQALLDVGLIRQYDDPRREPGRVSANNGFAYITEGAIGGHNARTTSVKDVPEDTPILTLHYWPGGRSVHHIERVEWSETKRVAAPKM